MGNMFIQRESASTTTSPLVAMAATLLAFAACAEQPTSLNPTAGASTGAGGASGNGGGAAEGSGGDLGDARVLFFAAEEGAVTVTSNNPSNPTSVDRGDARLFTLPALRDCPSGASTCVAFTRSGESSADRLPVDPGGLLVHIFAGGDGLDGDVTIETADIPSPGGDNAGVHYRSLVSFVEYGVLNESNAFEPFRAGFNQVAVDGRITSFDSESGIVRVELPEPLAVGGRYVMVVGEEPGGHFVTYCSLDGDEEDCASFPGNVGR